MSLLRPLARPAWRCSTVCARTYASKAPPKAPAKASAKAGKPSGGAKAAGTPVSAAPENTVLTGLNYLKGQAEVLALPDSAYPPWLWNVLKPRVYEDEGPGSEGERVRRREERRQRIRDSNFMKTQ